MMENGASQIGSREGKSSSRTFFLLPFCPLGLPLSSFSDKADSLEAHWPPGWPFVIPTSSAIAISKAELM